jgi:UPF0716 family protein affecting phage T7 exclusion
MVGALMVVPGFIHSVLLGVLALCTLVVVLLAACRHARATGKRRDREGEVKGAARQEGASDHETHRTPACKSAMPHSEQTEGTWVVRMSADGKCSVVVFMPSACAARKEMVR